jgi:hypothetical protein
LNTGFSPGVNFADDGLGHVLEPALQPRELSRQRLTGGLRGPAELLRQLVEDDLLRADRVPGLHHLRDGGLLRLR